MGFDLFLKTDLPIGERAVQALAEFGKLATERGWGHKFGSFGLDSGDYDWTGLGHVMLWRPEDNLGPFESPCETPICWACNLLGESTHAREGGHLWGQALTEPDPDHQWTWDPSLYPGSGECVLAWTEIEWFRFIPPAALQCLHDSLAAHDALTVWADILAAQDSIGAFTDAVLGKFAQTKGGEYIKGGRSG